MIIYRITNKNTGKVYIGQTTAKLRVRMSKHRTDRNGVMYFAFKKWGEESFSIDVIDTATSRDELDKKEIDWISYYKANGPVYNRAAGGGGTSGTTRTEKTKKRISDALKGKEKSAEHRAMLKKNHAGLRGENSPTWGRKHTDEEKKKCGAVNIGKPRSAGCVRSDAAKEKNRIAHLGKKTGVENSNYGTGREVVNISTGKVFVSSCAAGVEYNISPSAIRQACKRNGCAGGYEWRYEEAESA